jgi:GDP-L-fucose synthase
MKKDSRIFVAGGEKKIGAAIVRELERQGYQQIVGQGNTGLNLLDSNSVEDFFQREKPEYVICAAGKSGGISANQKYPADLMLDNLLVECHVIHAAHTHHVRKLLYLASSCCYPKHAPQPMKEEYLSTGALEPTNEAYATAKIAGIKLCEAYRQQHNANFITAIPTNYFGPEDDFSAENSHVIGALFRKMHDAVYAHADSVTLWGTGKARREFIYVDDLARASIMLMNNYDGASVINIGSGEALSIAELAKAIQRVTGFQGELVFDTSKPDGMAVKILDSRRLMALGWEPVWSFDDALKRTYDWFLKSRFNQ